MTEANKVALQTLANELGTTPEHIWNVLLAQVRAEIWGEILVLILAAVVVAVLLGFALREWKKAGEDRDDFMGIVAIVATIALVGLLATTIGSVTERTINPEGVVLNRILEQLR
jgi:hypothetical protein